MIESMHCAPIHVMWISIGVAALVGGVIGWLIGERYGRREMDDALATGEFRAEDGEIYRVLPSRRGSEKRR